jgi:hypothetical protein
MEKTTLPTKLCHIKATNLPTLEKDDVIQTLQIKKMEMDDDSIVHLIY